MALKEGRSAGFSNNGQRNIPDDVPRDINALGRLYSLAPENQNVPLSSNYLQPYSTSPRTLNAGPPPLPPRHNQYMSPYNRYPGLGMTGSYYSPYSRFSSAYSPYGNYRMPYGHFGAAGESYNSFVQMAEESTRPAFESIESVVQVVSSISMMLESTYHAVHSSYSAILGVVDQFSRLKDHLAQILSVLAVYRGLRWLCLKFLYLLRLRKENPSVEAAWNSAEQLGSGIPPGSKGSSAWPFLMFISLVIGAPWLMFKLLSKNVAKSVKDMSAFRDENGRSYVATASHDFSASQRNELSFKAGEKLVISPKSMRSNPKGGWFLACNDKHETGLVPSTYLLSKVAQKAARAPTAQVRVAPFPGNSVHPAGVMNPSPELEVVDNQPQPQPNEKAGDEKANAQVLESPDDMNQC